MSYFNLPSSLHRKFVNLSLTVQQLVGEIVLTIEGMPTSDNRAENAKLEQAARARRANELINEQIRSLLTCNRLSNEDGAIALATVNGRSTKEIGEFLGMETKKVMRRLCEIKRAAQRWRPMEQAEMQMGGEVLELFAEAQRR